MNTDYGSIAGGVWPTMLTPMHADGSIDYDGLDSLVEWYIAAGVSGLFAVCQSSEMFHLSLSERVTIAERVVRRAAGRVGVIASGNTSDRPEEQVEELSRIAETGVDALVLVVNRFAKQGEDDVAWRSRVEQVIERLPRGTVLGLYECPVPYHRLLSVDSLDWIATLRRFAFLKDTCCSAELQRQRSRQLAGSGLRLYNANSATLLSSLRAGYAGFSGVMANFHPQLYVWMCRFYDRFPEQADRLQDLLGAMSVFELQRYPVNAKRFLVEEGVLASAFCRKTGDGELAESQRLELQQLARTAARELALLQEEEKV